MTTVFNLRTYDEYVYSLPPKEAVIAAYRQYELKDFNWWEKNPRVPSLRIHGRTVSCVDYAAIEKT